VVGNSQVVGGRDSKSAKCDQGFSYNAADALAAICDASFDGGCEHQVWGRGDRRGLEMGTLSSPVVTCI